MRLRYKISLVFILLLMVICIILGVSYKKYFYNKSIIVVDGNITINYANGNKFKDKNDKTINFTVTNNSDQEETFYVKLSNVYALDAQYSLIGLNDGVLVENKLISSIVSDQIMVPANATQEYEMAIKTNNNENYSGELVVALSNKASKTFADIIKDNNEVKEKPITSFSENAYENEGLIKDVTEAGTLYYFRGNVTNNYVTFADNLWQIVKINEDGSVKLVLNKTIDMVSSYISSEDINFENSLIATTLNDWQSVYLASYTDKIASHKFCNDTLITEGNEYYAAYDRINKNYIPNNNCFGTLVNANIGLLTADEVVMAGALSTDNTSYYLYNPDITTSYYTMTSAKINNNGYYPFVVNSNGALSTESLGTESLGIRPVINIIKNVSATGDGSKENPYKLLDI